MPIPAVNVWAVIYVSAAERGRTRKLTFGGISSALILLTLAASAFLPTADLSLFSLSSLALAVVVIEAGQPLAWLVFLSTALLSLAWPGLALSWPFLLFFGPYPLLRGLIDGRFTAVTAQLLRLGAGVLLGGVAVFCWGRETLLAWTGRFGLLAGYLALPLALLGLFIYDLALGMLIRLYLTRLAPYLKK